MSERLPGGCCSPTEYSVLQQPHTALRFPVQGFSPLGAFLPLSHHHFPADLQNFNLFVKLFQIWLKLASDFRSYQGSLTLQLHVLNFLKKQTRTNTLQFCYRWDQAVALLSAGCTWLADLSWPLQGAYWSTGTLRQNVEATTANALPVFWEFSTLLESSYGLCCTRGKKALPWVLYLSFLQQERRNTGGNRFKSSPLVKTGQFCG